MFINILTQVIILLVLVMLGFILAKKDLINEQGAKNMTDLVMYFATPCVIIKSFIRQFDPDLLKELLLTFLFAVVSHIAFIILSILLVRDNDKRKQRVLQFGVIFSNCGYMSLPLQEALLGETGVFYSSSYIVIFNLFIWSYGILLMSGDRKYLSPRKLIINPGVIAIVVGMIIFLFSIPLPKVVSEPISYIASLNTPLPMIIIGYHLANGKISDGIKSLKCLWAIFLKLFAFPLLALLALYLCGVKGDMLVSLVISCSAPTAAITTMFSAKFEQDTSLSVNLVSLSTVLSVISMPIVVTLAQYLA